MAELKLRVPDDLHEELRARAHRERTSINRLATSILDAEVMVCSVHAGAGFAPELDCATCRYMEGRREQ